MSFELLNHRVQTLEDKLDDHIDADKNIHKELEIRVRALEIAHGKLIGYAAGGAFVGGLAFQLARMVFGK